MKILFTGGGTAGHIFPIIAVAREFKKKNSGNQVELFYLGPRDEFSQDLLSREGIRVNFILAGKIRRYFSPKSVLQNIFDILVKVPAGFLHALYYVFIISPDLIFSKGGYGSLPSVLAGWLLLTPVFLHESDVAPGLANRLLSRFSVEVFVSFPVEKTGYFPSEKMICVGNPIRKEILEGKNKKAENTLKLKGGRSVILVLGGSQGSERINDTILAVLPNLLSDFEIIHQVGTKNFAQVAAEVKIVAEEKLRQYYHIFPFLGEEELKQAYGASSLVVARAGSGTIFEIATQRKPSLLIPLPEAAQNHQLKNAYAYAENGACQVLEEANLTSRFFLERIKYLLSSPDKLKQMAEGASSFAKPSSAKIIAAYLEEYLSQ